MRKEPLFITQYESKYKNRMYKIVMYLYEEDDYDDKIFHLNAYIKLLDTDKKYTHYNNYYLPTPRALSYQKHNTIGWDYNHASDAMDTVTVQEAIEDCKRVINAIETQDY